MRSLRSVAEPGGGREGPRETQGTWEVVAATFDGRQLINKTMNSLRFVFHNETLTWLRGWE